MDPSVTAMDKTKELAVSMQHAESQINTRASVVEHKHAGDEEGQEEEQEETEADEEEGEEEEDEDEMLMRQMQPRAVRTKSDKTCTRRIIAEDESWTLCIVPSLADICLRHIADNFCFNPCVLSSLPYVYQRKIISRLPPTLPLHISVPFIDDDDDYWARCCRARWTPAADVKQYGGSWKRMMMEKTIESIIENYVPVPAQCSRLQAIIPLAANIVRRLIIRQLLPPVKVVPDSNTGDYLVLSDTDSTHFDFDQVLPQLTSLEEFSITYGVSDCGMNFEWKMFHFTRKDCRQLADAVAKCPQLRVFRIHRSKVDDARARLLVGAGLSHLAHVSHVDMSFNVISDVGARAVAAYMGQSASLTALTLVDNNIRASGARALAHGLAADSCSLHSLDLRLNYIGDEGVVELYRVLTVRNRSLTSINVSSNLCTEMSASALADMLRHNSVITAVDITCNQLAGGCRQVVDAVTSNTTLLQLDLRMTGCSPELMHCAHTLLVRNRQQANVDVGCETAPATDPPDAASLLVTPS